MGHLVIDFEHVFCCWGFPKSPPPWPSEPLATRRFASWCRGETPTWGKGKSSSKMCFGRGYVGSQRVQVDWWHEFHVISKLQNYLVQYPTDILKRYTIQTIHIVIEVRSLRLWGGDTFHPNTIETKHVFHISYLHCGVKTVSDDLRLIHATCRCRKSSWTHRPNAAALLVVWGCLWWFRYVWLY